MTTFDRHEAAKFAQVASAAGQEFLEARDKILSDGAGRGFPMVPGEGLSALIQAGLKARQKLTEAGGKVYEEERARILELSDFNLKLIVENARNTMLVYKAALKRYEEEVQHDLRVQEIDQELLIEAEETGVAALRLLKEQVRRALKEYENDVRGQVLALKLLHDEGKIDLNLLIHLARLTVSEEFLIALDRNELLNVDNLLETELRNIRSAGEDVERTTRASALQQTSVESSTINTSLEWIGKI